MAQTSDRISSLASRYAGISSPKLQELCSTREGLNEVAYDIRSMAASLLRQDETPGLRGVLKRLLG